MCSEKRSVRGWLLDHEGLNFVLTNRLPRALVTRAVARISRSRQPIVRGVSMKLWTYFAGDLALHEAKRRDFASVHECFTRELKDGARPVDPSPDVLVSPCDGIVGSHGPIAGARVFQAKGVEYSLEDLLLDRDLASSYADGCYVTLRLTSAMYHRFHAPDDCRVDHVSFVPGDVWNVNPPALKRVPRLFCRNERAVVPLALRNGPGHLTLVPVTAILVASLRLHCLGRSLDSSTGGPVRLTCQATYRRGQEMGYFEHGSTIIVLASREFGLAASVTEGARLRMGQPLLTSGRRAAGGQRQG